MPSLRSPGTSLRSASPRSSACIQRTPRTRISCARQANSPRSPRAGGTTSASASGNRMRDVDAALAAAGALRLNGRTFHRAEGTKHAAIAGIGLEHRAAALAFIEELARVRRHGLGACEAAFRTREHGFMHEVVHRHGSDSNRPSFIYCFTFDGYPALAVALRRASTFVFASSKVTTASCCSRLAATFPTPSTFFNALPT